MVFLNSQLHWSVNLVVMSVFILSELGCIYIYNICIYIYIHTEFTWLLDGRLQLKIMATPLLVYTYINTYIYEHTLSGIQHSQV